MRPYGIHRLNVRAQLGREAVWASAYNASDVRFDFVRAAPDLATYMIVLRTVLSMRVVMPSMVSASEAEPYMCMARFETGAGTRTSTAFRSVPVAHAWGVFVGTSPRTRRTTALRTPTTTARTRRR